MNNGPCSKGDLQLAGPFSAALALLRRLGVDPAEVLPAAGLSVNPLDNPATLIPSASVGRLLELAAERSNSPHFALEAGMQVCAESLGSIGKVIRNAPTLGDAILEFIDNQQRNAYGNVAYLLRLGHTAYFGYAAYQPRVHGHHLICDWVAAAAMNLIRELTGAAVDKNVLEVSFSRPEPADRTPYERALGVRLCFNSGQNAIRLPCRFLQQPVKGADKELRHEFESQMKRSRGLGQVDTLTHLRRLLRVAVLKGHVSAEEIAGSMAVSRRTLHRRLSSLGTRFEEVVAETRFGFAEQLLSDTRLNISEISTLVGYADPSILNRLFRRRAGISPTKWRALQSNALKIPAVSAVPISNLAIGKSAYTLGGTNEALHPAQLSDPYVEPPREVRHGTA